MKRGQRRRLQAASVDKECSTEEKRGGSRFEVLGDDGYRLDDHIKPAHASYRRLRSQQWESMPLSDKQRIFLASKLGRRWIDLAREGLSFSDAEIDQLEHRWSRDLKRQALEMLAMWIERNGSSVANAGAANRGLKRCGLKDMAEKHESFARMEMKAVNEKRERRVSFGKSEVRLFDKNSSPTPARRDDSNAGEAKRKGKGKVAKAPVAKAVMNHLETERGHENDRRNWADHLNGTKWAVFGELPVALRESLRQFNVCLVTETDVALNQCIGVLVLVSEQELNGDNLQRLSRILTNESLVIVNVLQLEAVEPPLLTKSAARLDYFRPAVRNQIGEKLGMCLATDQDCTSETVNLEHFREDPYFQLNLRSSFPFLCMQSLLRFTKRTHLCLFLAVILLIGQFGILLVIANDFLRYGRRALSVLLANSVLRTAGPMCALSCLMNPQNIRSLGPVYVPFCHVRETSQYFIELYYYQYSGKSRLRMAANTQAIQRAANRVSTLRVVCSLIHVFLLISFLAYCCALSYPFYAKIELPIIIKVFDYFGLLLALGAPQLAFVLHAHDMDMLKHSVVLGKRKAPLLGIDWERVSEGWRSAGGMTIIYFMTGAVVVSCLLHPYSEDSYMVQNSFIAVTVLLIADCLGGCPCSLMVFIGTILELIAYPSLGWFGESLWPESSQAFFTVWILFLLQKGAMVLVYEPAVIISSGTFKSITDKKEYVIKFVLFLVLFSCWLITFGRSFFG